MLSINGLHLGTRGKTKCILCLSQALRLLGPWLENSCFNTKSFACSRIYFDLVVGNHSTGRLKYLLACGRINWSTSRRTSFYSLWYSYFCACSTDQSRSTCPLSTLILFFQSRNTIILFRLSKIKVMLF